MGGPVAQGDLALSAGLHFLTPWLAGLIGMTREWSTNRAVRPLGLWGRRPPQPHVLTAAHQAEEGPLWLQMWWLDTVE